MYWGWGRHYAPVGGWLLSCLCSSRAFSLAQRACLMAVMQSVVTGLLAVWVVAGRSRPLAMGFLCVLRHCGLVCPQRGIGCVGWALGGTAVLALWPRSPSGHVVGHLILAYFCLSSLALPPIWFGDICPACGQVVAPRFCCLAHPGQTSCHFRHLVAVFLVPSLVTSWLVEAY